MKPASFIAADESGIAQAADRIQSGGVIVYPTETVYGLGADPFNPSAFNRIFALKGREAEKGLILLIQKRQDLEALAAEVPVAAETLMEAFWPGPLTLVFAASPGLPEHLLGPTPTIALRMSDATIANALVRHVGGPITSTSANLSGRSPARSAQDAADVLGDRVDLILDGGTAPDPRPSTLVDVSVRHPRILRPGRIAETDINRILTLESD
ncbi:MAG: L-threonylcarbamoyladenylate synthase [Gemmatimonadetes bacterium]|nr:L-threonylcarbamoyladenylate synthase [Gemmatimonadota bacterium]MDE3258316.1 L-threonylcarbamoyladenylate synthase [Gemmatimonadota bacterium]